MHAVVETQLSKPVASNQQRCCEALRSRPLAEVRVFRWHFYVQRPAREWHDLYARAPESTKKGRADGRREGTCVGPTEETRDTKPV